MDFIEYVKMGLDYAKSLAISEQNFEAAAKVRDYTACLIENAKTMDSRESALIDQIRIQAGCADNWHSGPYPFVIETPPHPKPKQPIKVKIAKRKQKRNRRK